MNSLSIFAIIATIAVVSAIPIVQNGNDIQNSLPVTTSGYTSSAANCGQVEFDIFDLNVNGTALQDLFQFISFNGGQGVNFASTTPYTLTLPISVGSGGIKLEIILSSLQGSFASPTTVGGPFNASVDIITVSINGNTANTIAQNYSAGGNNFTFPLANIGNGSVAVITNFSVTIAQVFPAQDGLATNSTCSTQYVLAVTNPANTTVRGDPQFVGLRGQSYQIHGIDGAVYNIITDSKYQLNARFTFLSGPRPCPLMPSTGRKSSACWTHDGSYLSEIGLQVGDDTIVVVSGPASTGFSSVARNGKALAVGDSIPSVTFNSTHELTLSFGAWTIEVENSDMFVNFRSVRVAPAAWSSLKSHGLLGQTWSNKVYSGRVSAIEGEVDDYMIADDSLFGNTFIFNKFE